MKNTSRFFESGTGNLENKDGKPGGSLLEGHQDYRAEECGIQRKAEGAGFV